MSSMLPLPKLKAMLLYFIENTNPLFLGKVKLMKLFYFTDFDHVKKYGVPVTYDNYINLEHGPVPSTIDHLVDSVEEDTDRAILGDTIFIEQRDGQNIHRIKGSRSFTDNDEKLFSEIELETMAKVAARFSDKNTNHIEQASHNQAPWLETKELDTIPYSLAAHDPDSLLTEEEIEFLTEVTR